MYDPVRRSIGQRYYIFVFTPTSKTQLIKTQSSLKLSRSRSDGFVSAHDIVQSHLGRPHAQGYVSTNDIIQSRRLGRDYCVTYRFAVGQEPYDSFFYDDHQKKKEKKKKKRDFWALRALVVVLVVVVCGVIIFVDAAPQLRR